MTGTGSATATEHGRRERREAADVRAHHEHVSRVSAGSATKQESRASRRASSWRSAPWHACTCTVPSAAPANGVGGRSYDVALQVAAAGWCGAASSAGHDDRVTEAADEAGRLERRTPHERTRGCPPDVVVASASRRRATKRPGVCGGERSQAPGEGTRRTRRHRGPCRGRRARRAGRPIGRWARTAPRGGTAGSSRPARRSASAVANCSAGWASPMRSRTAWNSSNCHAIEASSGPTSSRSPLTVPSPGTPAAHCASTSGRFVAYWSKRSAMWRATTYWRDRQHRAPRPTRRRPGAAVQPGTLTRRGRARRPGPT